MEILYICTGNTCRSPMAEAITHAIARERGLDADATSAGISAVPGLGTSVGAMDAVIPFGGDLEQHRSRQVTEGMVRQADRVLCMERRHLWRLKALYPRHADKMDTLTHAAGLSEPDIPDPFGGSPEVYERCCRLIAKAVQAVLKEATQ